MLADALYLAAEAGFVGQRFCVYHAPHGVEPKGSLLYVHPFAEEMNKSRRMAAVQSRALARAGYGVLQMDLTGCGDSCGDFDDATWRGWVDDIVRAAGWLRHRAAAPLWIWGLRAGCLLAADAARRLEGPCNLVFWQPPAKGKALLQQFLRLRVAAEMMSGSSNGALEALRTQLAAGVSVEIAGYVLSPVMAAELEGASLTPPPTCNRGCRLELIELSSLAETPPLAPASQRVADAWAATGWAVRSRVVSGPAFWQTAEIEEAPNLLAATVAALDGTAQP